MRNFIIKSRKMRWARHVTGMEEKTNARRILGEKRSLEILKIILKMILKKWNWRVWSGFI
jgi:hypothetical protein